MNGWKQKCERILAGDAYVFYAVESGAEATALQTLRVCRATIIWKVVGFVCGSFPSPDAALGDGSFAARKTPPSIARCPYLLFVFGGIWLLKLDNEFPICGVNLSATF
jgi:hypothetical protein